MSLFGEFRRAWREAVDNFWHELEGDAGAEGVYREVSRARNQLEQLTRDVAETRQRLAEERELLDACRRRERMAHDIGDSETARVAAEYADRHGERALVLERKAEALEAERALCRRDLDEMERALQDGRVTDGTGSARESARASLEDLNRHPFEPEFRDLEDADREKEAAERLERLKRRMDG
ncbi:MAG TPA: hypothetical protein VK966_05690 [Longimicrobiales bacterium]|nr:hypothetical protein [Longimicrobiales bacterium]